MIGRLIFSQTRCQRSFVFKALSLRKTEPRKHIRQALSLAFLDVVERFYQYFSQYPDSIPLLLQFTLGNTGAYHPHPRVRAKACAIFSSLARVLKPQLLGSVQLITASVEGLLESSLEMNDKCALYETLGILIAPQGSDFPQAAQYLKLLSQPLLNGLNASLQQQGSGLLVANNTLFLAYLSKGFSGLSAPTMGKISGDVTAIWKEIAEAVVHCCRVYATVPQVREKVLLFMHRIIDLLGRGVSAYIPPLMECLISNCDLADMSKLVRVPTQLLQRIKREIVPGLEPSFAPLITRVFQVTDLSWLDKGPTTSEQAREHLDLLRAYYGLLAQATQPECIDVFVSDNSRKIFNQILDSIVRGCVSNPELDIAKTSYQIMTKMATCWYSSLPGFSDFLAQQAIPMTVATVKQAHYNPNDAKCHSVAGEIAALYLVLNKAAGEDAFINALKSAWSLPDDHAAMMKQVLSTNDQKAVRNLTKTWAAAVRGQG
ncbi:Exportin-T [Diplonema papillatum]|nr:Exportin-T [Diplonema papillatum]